MSRRRGRIVAEYVADCGRCDAEEDLAERSRREALRQAREWGWRYTRACGWVCPDCLRMESAAHEVGER